MAFGWDGRGGSPKSWARGRGRLLRTLRRGTRGARGAPKPDSQGPDGPGETGDKRDQVRVPLEGEVRGEVMVFQPMMVVDLSLGGAQIETAFPLHTGSLHDFRLSLADRSVIVKGRIAHCHIGGLTDSAALYRTGIEFVTLSEHAHGVIADFVVSHARGTEPDPS